MGREQDTIVGTPGGLRESVSQNVREVTENSNRNISMNEKDDLNISLVSSMEG